MSDIHILETDLDLKQNLNIYTTCKQLDTLHLKLNIYDDGLQATLTNYNVRLKAMKADKVPLIQDTGITINNNVATIIGDEQLTTTSGNTLVELQFINKTTGEKKATFNLVLKVIATTLEVNRSISTATYTLLQELENKLDQASDFFENIDEAITSNANLIATNNTANSTKKALDTSNTTALATKTALDTLNATATNTKKVLDTSNTLAVTTKNNLEVANVQAVKNYDALNALGDATDLAKKVQENTAQLSESVQQIENVNKLAINKAEKIVVEQLKNQINSFQVEQSSGMTDTGSLELKATRNDILGNNFDTANSRINNIENILKNNTSNIVFNDWEIGAIGDNGVDISTYPRIRSGFHAIENGLKVNIEVKDGYKLGIYLYDSNKKFISRVNNIIGSSEFTISSYYTRLTIGKANETQIELSEKNNINISYQFKESEKQMLNINEFDKTVGKNICPPTFFEYIMSGDPLNGYKLYKSDSKNPCTYIFPCKPNMEYTLTIKKLNSDRFRIFESKILDIQYNQVYTNEILKLYEADDSNMRTFTTGVETKAIIVYVNRDSVVLPEWCQCEEGKEFTGYEEYSTEKYLNANYNLIDKKSIDYDFDFKGKIISNILDKNYEPSSDYIDWNLSGNYLNTIYGWWDSLVSKYPEYITKKTQGTDATGLPIYRYDFVSKPVQWNPFSVDRMKIIYLGGIHGHERKNVCEDFRFFKDLCEKHNENSSLKMLYDNVYFIVIPVVCPWGVDNLKRVNSNGVNINRNFPSWWTYLANDANYNYSGETPASELETQAIIKLLDLNKDAVFVIDHHNSSGFADQGYLTFANMGREIDQRIIVPTFNRLDSQIKNKYSWILRDNPNIKNKNIYRTGIPLNSGTLYTEIHYKGMHGMLLETSPTHNGNTILYPNGSEQDIQAITVETIGSILETVVLNNNLLYS